jgi:hypothetical protein
MIPESPTLLIIAGLVLIIVGIIVGRLKIEEISVPNIGKIARSGALIFGLFLLVFGIVLEEPGNGDTYYDDQYKETEFAP